MKLSQLTFKYNKLTKHFNNSQEVLRCFVHEND